MTVSICLVPLSLPLVKVKKEQGGRERGGECPVENREKPRLPKVFEPRFSSVQTIGKPRETSGNLGFVTEGNFGLGFGPT